MRLALWPSYPPTQIDAEIAEYESGRRIVGEPGMVIVAERDGGKLCGFVEIGLRRFADGCASSPVGYLEGWYVDPDLRRKGIGRALVAAAEDWARRQGCSEMASDGIDDNQVSYASHLRLK